ncbi:MAG TPA: hypothetical protein VKQ52_04690 [Puia sp.]|jgi:hypothetical protein|nr:hypothetical protein [Puia sp.]
MPQDIVFASDGDIDFSANDLQYGESTAQHQRDILLARKGDYKMSPTVGVGIMDYLLDHTPDEMQREIRQQLYQDGMDVNKITYSNGLLTIDAPYAS